MCDLDRLLSIHQSFSPKKVLAVFRASCENFVASNQCLLNGATLFEILRMLHLHFSQQATIKLRTSVDDVWVDTVTHYKSDRCDCSKQLRIQLDGQPALDTGGVRNALYSMVFEHFAFNEHVRLFDGCDQHLRPMCSAESRSSGLWKVLGKMVAHSIAQNGIGFPYFSPTMYWYMADGEERSLQYLCLEDVGADVATVVNKVYYFV